MKNLSTKEVNYIKDLMSWELLSSKKCFQYSHQELDTAHQKVFYEAASIHQENYLNLLDYVNKVGNMQGGQMN